MSKQTNTNETPEATAEGSACDCGCGCGSDCTCACNEKGCCCPLGPKPELTLGFWVLRAWLGARAFFTGLSKFETTVVEETPGVSLVRMEDYGSKLANTAAKAALSTGQSADNANLDLAAKGAKAAAEAAQLAAKNAEAAIAALKGAANNSEAFQKASESTVVAIDVANSAVKAANSASLAVADVLKASESSVVTTVHHGLPRSGDWTLQSFTNADLWYMPKWALLIFDNCLGYILIALGVTLLLGIGTRLSLFFQGLLYTGLTLGFVAISKEPGSSAGITMLGVHVALIVGALALAKYNKLDVQSKIPALKNL